VRLSVNTDAPVKQKNAGLGDNLFLTTTFAYLLDSDVALLYACFWSVEIENGTVVAMTQVVGAP
jgi:hypothetical protein